MILTELEVTQYLFSAGFSGTALRYAVDICHCESDFNTDAHNTSGEDSRGLMQINVNAHPQYANLNLFDPLINCMVAKEIYAQAGNSFQPWTCAHLLGLVTPPGSSILLAGFVLLGGFLYYRSRA